MQDVLWNLHGFGQWWLELCRMPYAICMVLVYDSLSISLVLGTESWALVYGSQAISVGFGIDSDGLVYDALSISLFVLVLPCLLAFLASPCLACLPCPALPCIDRAFAGRIGWGVSPSSIYAMCMVLGSPGKNHVGSPMPCVWFWVVVARIM